MFMDPVTAGPMVNVKREGSLPVYDPRQTADIGFSSHISANTNPSGYYNKAVKPTRSDEVNSERARKWLSSAWCAAHAQHSASVLEAANCDCQSRCIGGLHDSGKEASYMSTREGTVEHIGASEATGCGMPDGL